MPNLKLSIPYPSRRDDERCREQANDQIEKFYEIFKDMSFEISFTDALILMPKFASTLKALIGNKDKLSKMARSPMNEHCSAVILNKLPKKLGVPDKFLIPCEFSGMDECLALANLGASINLMPLSVWKELSLLELTPTCMTLELADVKVKVGMFYFPVDFVVVDFEPDPRVPLILASAMTTVMTAMLRQFQATPPPAPVKVVEETCVTCGGSHLYYQCLATGGNTFPVLRDNIQEYGSAAAAKYNQGNPGYRPQGVANQIRPPGFAQSNVQNNHNRFGPPQGYNRGNNFNQEPSYQAIAQHNQNIHLNELERIKKMNEVSMKAMQNQIDMVKNKLRNEMKTSIQTSLSNQTNEIRDMMASSLRMNTASPSSSGTLPGNTVANPKSNLKAIIARSGVSYDGPSISPPVVENAPGHKGHTSIPYPFRRNDERNQEKAKDQIEKFYQLFKDMSFEISFTDALILMPKFASTLKALISNKEKLSEMARTPLNEHCSAVLLKKLPEKLGDPGKFSIPCDFSRMAECLALTDLGVSINLMPYSVWRKLSLPDLTPTCMTLELADRSISRPVGVAEDVYIKVGELTLRVGKEAITFNLDQTSRYSANYNDMTAKRIDEANAFLGLEDDPNSPELDPSYYDPEGDIQMLEAFLNSDPAPSLPNHEQSVPSFTNELKACEAKTVKSFVDERLEVELKDLPPHLEYAFLEGNNKLPVIIAKE
nr:reverse transcriptase domain-containing protein [Tanacetum cinerariifolium]